MTTDNWKTHIQWKGTAVCMDIICPACGLQEHMDEEMMSSYKCPNPECGKVWKLGTEVSLEETNDPYLVEYAKTKTLVRCDDCQRLLDLDKDQVMIFQESPDIKVFVCRKC